MVKKIILSDNGVGQIEDTAPFLLPDELSINFESKYDLSSAVVGVQNNNEQGVYKYSSEFKVPQKFLFGGLLKLTVRAYAGDTLVKSWGISPIKIVEAEGKIIAFDLLTSTIKRVDTIQGIVEDIASKHNGLVEHVKSLKENY